MMYAMHYGCKELKCALICLFNMLGKTAKQSVLILIVSYSMLYL